MKRRLPTLLLLFLAFNTTWFVLYSAQLGLQALLSDTPETLSRVFRRDSPLSGAGLALHMIAGGLLCLFAPLQALPVLRNRWPQIHRRLGYVLISLALITGIAGLFYITVQGTIGGWWMSLWFSLYGLALMWSALRTAQCAIRKDRRAHQIWATRLIILAVGSWIFRMHYVLWFLFNGGLGSAPDLTGPFDRIQVVAFFVPYLLLAEIFLRRLPRNQPD
jgi:uncharacterized membrane protein